jgi:hypothetical protein
MNKRSVKKRPAKASRNRVVRKTAARRVSGKSGSTKASAPKAGPTKTMPIKSMPSESMPTKSVAISSLLKTAAAPGMAPVAQQITMPGPLLRSRSHRFSVGQTVSYTSSPVSRPGASGTYKVVKLLPSDGDDYQYRIKNAGEAFERVAKESQLELEFEH